MAVPVRNLLVGVVVKFGANYVLLGDPNLGAVGASQHRHQLGGGGPS